MVCFRPYKAKEGETAFIYSNYGMIWLFGVIMAFPFLLVGLPFISDLPVLCLSFVGFGALWLLFISYFMGGREFIVDSNTNTMYIANGRWCNLKFIKMPIGSLDEFESAMMVLPANRRNNNNNNNNNSSYNVSIKTSKGLFSMNMLDGFDYVSNNSKQVFVESVNRYFGKSTKNIINNDGGASNVLQTMSNLQNLVLKQQTQMEVQQQLLNVNGIDYEPMEDVLVLSSNNNDNNNVNVSEVDCEGDNGHRTGNETNGTNIVNVRTWTTDDVKEWLEIELQKIYANEPNLDEMVNKIQLKLKGFNGNALLGLKNDNDSLKSMFINDLATYYNVKTILEHIH